MVYAGSALTCSKLHHVTYYKMASKHGKESGATAFCSELNREGMNILVVKDTTHTGVKDICTKANVITLASLTS